MPVEELLKIPIDEAELTRKLKIGLELEKQGKGKAGKVPKRKSQCVCLDTRQHYEDKPKNNEP